MGLGPSVCQHCQVMAELKVENDRHVWYCPICGNTDCRDYTGFSIERINQCNENRRVYEFFRGNKWPISNGEK